jgi:O-antigen/teichoic acid export membrane protein
MLGYLQSSNMFIQINIISMFEMILKNIILLFSIFILKEESLKSIIIVLIFASLCSYIFTVFIFAKSYIKQFKNIRSRVNFFILKEYWHFNFKTFISSSLKAGNNNIDTLLIAYFINANMVGIYQIIKKILTPSSFIVKPFSMLLYPKLIKYFENKDIKNLKNLIFRISMILFIVIISYIICIYLGIEIIFNIINVEFIVYYKYLYILLSLVTILVSMQWWGRIFSNTVNPNYSLYSNLFATLFQLTITILSTYLFELEGLVFSLITMNLFLFIYWVIKLRNLREII